MERNRRTSLDSSSIYGRFRDYSNDVVRSRPHARVSIGGYYEMPSLPKKKPILTRQATNIPKPISSLNMEFLNPKPPPKIVNSINHSTNFHKSTSVAFGEINPGNIKTSKKNIFSKFKTGNRLMPNLISGLAITLFILGITISAGTLRSNKEVAAQVKGLSANNENGTENSTPSEDSPTGDIKAYSVAPDLPKIVTIKKADVNARVSRVGVNTNNEMTTPRNVFNVGWYDASSKPGENGTIVLNGHVSGPTKKGVFYGLGKLIAGDKISIERGDSKLFNYTVVKIEKQKYTDVDMSKMLISSIPGKPGLNLITCSGKFNSKTNSFDDRTVVYAVQD